MLAETLGDYLKRSGLAVGSSNAVAENGVRRESRLPLIRLGLRVAQGVAFVAPVFGLLVFALVPCKPAVTLYAVIIGLAVVLSKALEPARLSAEITETVRRYLHGTDAH